MTYGKTFVFIYFVFIYFRSDLMVKKLRYYARFIVVCLLLKKMKLVRDLVRVSFKNISRKFKEFRNRFFSILKSLIFFVDL